MLAYETGATNTVDPLGGSYFIEALTKQMANEARAYFEPHTEHSAYAERLTEGRSIGSGLVEGSCKQVIGRRLKQTGAAGYETDEFGNPLNYPNGFVNQDLGLASLLQAEITWAGTTQYIDWGKKAFAPGENGGIVGIVFYDLTRNELDALEHKDHAGALRHLKRVWADQEGLLARFLERREAAAEAAAGVTKRRPKKK